MQIQEILRGLKYRSLAIEENISLKRFNLIFGSNGSGKTTFSEALRECEDPGVRQFLNTPAGGESHVFNSEYVERELHQFTAGVDGVASIAIGKADVEDQRDKLRLESEIDTASQAVVQIEKRMQTLRTERKVGEDAKRSVLTALSGVEGFTSFQYKNDANLLEKILKSRAAPSSEDLDNAKKLAKSDPPKEIGQTPKSPSGIHDIWSESLELLLKVPQVKGAELNDISSEFRAWLLAGMSFLTEGRDDGPSCCPFCRNEIVATRLGALKETFSSDTAKLVESIEKQLDKIEEAKIQVHSSRVEWLPYESVVSPYAADIAAEVKLYVKWLSQIEKELEYLSVELIAKRDNPSKVWTGRKATIPLHDLEALTDLVRKHNEGARSNVQNSEKAIIVIEEDCLHEFTQDLLGVRSEMRRHERALAAARRRGESRKSELEKLRTRMSNKRESAEEINTILRHQMEVPRVRVTVSDDELTYYLKRDDGTSAVNLSEGERQAIALAYFIQSLKAGAIRPENTIVVLDDPVVALDEHRINVALYVIREATDTFSQVFLSTHSFHVLKQAAKLWDTNDRGEVAYFEMRKDETGTCSLRALPSHYLEFAGEYQYLFYRMASAAFGDVNCLSFDSRNVARRVLESFLEFQVPIRQGTLRSMLESAWAADSQLETFAPLIRGVVATFNSGSHSVPAAGSLDPWSYPKQEEVRVCYAIMMLLNQRHARSMLEAIFPPHSHVELHRSAKRYASKVTGVAKRIDNGTDPNFEAILPSSIDLSVYGDEGD